MRLISWNVMQGGGDRITKQVEYLAAQNPDVIALQEIFVNTDFEYRENLRRFGYQYAISSFDVMPDYHTQDGARRFGELVLSRWPVRAVPSPAPHIPWPERVLSVMVGAPRRDFELHVLYVPNGSNHKQKKRDTFECLYEGLSRHVDHPRVLCGDFCTPQLERLEQSEHKIEIVTWAYRKEDGTFRLRLDRGERWDVAERNILLGLAEFDLPDVFRLRHGCGELGYSMIQKNRDTVNYRRYDHIFASRKLLPSACEYLYEVLETQPKLSDHAPIQADFAGA